MRITITNFTSFQRGWCPVLCAFSKTAEVHHSQWSSVLYKAWFTYNRPDRFYRLCPCKKLSCDRDDYRTNQSIANVCGDWGDHDRWIGSPCSILPASLSLLRRKTAITEKIGGHEVCSFIEGCHCVGFRAKVIIFRRSSLITGDRDDHMRTPDRFQLL